MVTHIGQLPADHVTLALSGTPGTADFDFFRIDQDGVRAATPFKVPPQRVLIVTDVEWEISGPAQEFQTFGLIIKNLASGVGSRVFESSVILNNLGKGGKNEEMTSGFVVSSRGKIEVEMTAIAGRQYHVILRGYIHRE
jgi:hypothetical protein